MVTLQFSAGKSLMSRAICAATWSWASHVDFVLPDGRLFGAVASNGVCARELRLEHYSRCERHRADIPNEALLWALDQDGKDYDWSAIFGFIARRDWQNKDRWFCAELVQCASMQVGMPLLRGDYWRISPRDLLLSPLVELLERLV